MDVELTLISKIIETGDLATPTTAGISASFFLDPSARRVWETILRHRGDYGETPSRDVIAMDHPNYELVKDPDETFEFLVDRMRNQYSLWVIAQGLNAALDAHDLEDASGAIAALSATVNQVSLAAPTSRTTNLAGTGLDRINRYLSYKNLDGRLRGIPTGFHGLDEATQGWQKQQLITFVGLPKAGKSIMLMHSATAAHAAGYRPLFVGFEMSNIEQEDRHDAFRAGLNPSKLQNGKLTPAEWKQLRRTLNMVDSLPDFHLVEDAMAASTVSGLAAQVERHEPSIVFVDGVYMMIDEQGEPPNSPQALTNITRSLKRMAQRMDIPVVIATQALEWKSKGQKLTTGSIGYSSSFMQDSDDVIGVERTKDPLIASVRILAARNAAPLDLYILRDWDRGLVEELEGNPFEAADEEFASAAGF